MNKEEQLNLLKGICCISYQAGKEILKIYNSDFSVKNKEDKSPLTEADKKSHEAIMAGLADFKFPVLSEEGRDIPYAERADWDYFWMVDPLDGTKEFVKRNGEFTVNIALIHNQKAVMGVIYVPVSDELYFGAENVGAFKIDAFTKKMDQDFSEWLDSSNKLPKKMDRKYTMVGSRSHMSQETQDFMDQKKAEHGEVEIISKGSSLKLCMVAEGKADAYPRFAPTMEWDTAAGQAIVEAMGGEVIDWKTKKSLLYNREDLLNNWFLVNSGKD